MRYRWEIYFWCPEIFPHEIRAQKYPTAAYTPTKSHKENSHEETLYVEKFLPYKVATLIYYQTINISRKYSFSLVILNDSFIAKGFNLNYALSV